MQKERQFYALNDIGDNRTLFQFMDSIFDSNHAVIIAVKWIFGSNYKKYFSFLVESLNLICSSSSWGGVFALF